MMDRLDPNTWGILGEDGLVHLLMFEFARGDAVTRTVQTVCYYGKTRNGKDAQLCRGTVTCLRCLAGDLSP